jgi:flagellar biosynthesis/type III secretory pathway protein FliH
MTPIDVKIGRVMSAIEYAGQTEDIVERVNAREEAERIVAAAQEQAQQMMKKAEARALEHEAQLKEIADQSLERFLNEDAVDMTARALGSLLEQARQIRADLDEAEIWVIPLIRLAIKRIFGTIPEEDILKGAVSQSLNEVRDRWDLVLRCHPALQRQLANIIEGDQKLHAAIREVQIDRSLEVEDIRLVTAQGILDIGVNTQIETFLRSVEHFLGEIPHAP